MCGIAGLIGDHKYNKKIKFFNNILLKSIAHRGPDYSGSFVRRISHCHYFIRDYQLEIYQFWKSTYDFLQVDMF